jgi:hypothetical protein
LMLQLLFCRIKGIDVMIGDRIPHATATLHTLSCVAVVVFRHPLQWLPHACVIE